MIFESSSGVETLSVAKLLIVRLQRLTNSRQKSLVLMGKALPISTLRMSLANTRSKRVGGADNGYRGVEKS